MIIKQRKNIAYVYLPLEEQRPFQTSVPNHERGCCSVVRSTTVTEVSKVSNILQMQHSVLFGKKITLLEYIIFFLYDLKVKMILFTLEDLESRSETMHKILHQSLSLACFPLCCFFSNPCKSLF